MFILFPLILVLLLTAWKGMRIVPQQQVWVVQRLGKFTRQLEPGLNWVMPFADEIVNQVSLKEEAIEVPEQTAITQDNVSVVLDGIVYIKVFDPVAATYGVKALVYALIQLVQTTMRSEIGKIPLDETFEEREALNLKIVEVINEAADAWGVRCLRYEIKDIKIPEDIRKAMELQMTAERQKRARILESEGVRQSRINESEAAEIDRINRAKGESEAIITLARASADGIRVMANALSDLHGEKAAALQLAEKYVEAFSRLAKETNTVVLPANLQHPSAMIAEATSLYDTLKRKLPAPAVVSEKE